MPSRNDLHSLIFLHTPAVPSFNLHRLSPEIVMKLIACVSSRNDQSIRIYEKSRYEIVWMIDSMYKITIELCLTKSNNQYREYCDANAIE